MLAVLGGVGLEGAWCPKHSSKSWGLGGVEAERSGAD